MDCLKRFSFFVDHAEDGFKLRLLSHCWKILGSPQLSAAEWAPEIRAVVKRPRDWTTSSFFSDTMPHIVVQVSMGVPGDLLRIWERGFHSRSSVSFTFRALGPVQYKSELIEWADGVGKSKFSVGAAADQLDQCLVLAEGLYASNGCLGQMICPKCGHKSKGSPAEPQL